MDVFSARILANGGPKVSVTVLTEERIEVGKISVSHDRYGQWKVCNRERLSNDSTSSYRGGFEVVLSSQGQVSKIQSITKH